MKITHSRNEKGTALVLSMLLLLIATLIGISALNTSTYDIRISANEKASVQAFYAAEAGINEFMGRFRDGATNEITDDDPSNPHWKVLLAKYPGQGASRIGYVSGNPHSFSSLQNELDYGVEIRHKTDATNKVVNYAGIPIYILSSYGSTGDGGNKIVEVELIKSPNYDPTAALYSDMLVHVQGSSIYIDGRDNCGTMNKAGIVTTTSGILPITELGNPSIDGSPPRVTQTSIPGPTELPLQEMINYLKGATHFTYGFNENHTLSGYSHDWGIPTSNSAGVPLTYTGPMNIVYFNMSGTRTLKLTGGSHGAGILLVEGNLEIDGDFNWYGVILATGAVTFSGNGQKNVTGGILGGKNAVIETDGTANMIYCSAISGKLKDVIPPSKIIRWREIF